MALACGRTCPILKWKLFDGKSSPTYLRCHLHEGRQKQDVAMPLCQCWLGNVVSILNCWYFMSLHVTIDCKDYISGEKNLSQFMVMLTLLCLSETKFQMFSLVANSNTIQLATWEEVKLVGGRINPRMSRKCPFLWAHLGNTGYTIEQLRYAFKKKNRDYLGIFPNMGGGPPNSQNSKPKKNALKSP